ncbi:Isopenicillin N synthase [Trema orientale]|uniref:Isopenicillin N synthase n=1 Tax=Trema orientale TaxID=63057 RepID=A0A2P5EZ72_TREOI|nr:Isopenicillin N synthase [Trema orientale]
MRSITEDADGIPSYPPSLPAPNVQEMVLKDPLKVPERYTRNEEEMQKKAEMSHLSFQIPLIDLSLLSEGNKEELTKLDSACEKWGFFQVVNHGVPSEVLQGLKDASAEFFELPSGEKNKVSMSPNDIQGYGHAYVAYLNESKRVAEELLGYLSLVLGMDTGSLLELHKQVVQGLRLNYYPPCPMPDKVLGLSPHSDTSTITILAQDGNVAGLQIRHQEGWVPVEPIPNALVVNIGDVIEILSNGKYKSIEHRAVTNKTKARLSHAVFVVPHDEVEIEPLGHFIESHGSLPIYKKVNM